MSGEKMKRTPSGDVRRYGDVGTGWWENSNHGGDHAYELFKIKLEREGIKLTKDTKVLEIGSGNAAHLNSLHENGVDIVGIDARPRGDDGPQVGGRIEQMPFADESFDVVVGIAVFDADVYTQDQGMMLEDIARVLKPGGILISSAGSLNMVDIPKSLSEVTKKGFSLFERIYKKKS